MKTIIAPTDFSPISLNAVDYAADLACVIGANLSLVHICEMPLVIGEVQVPEYGIAEMMDDAEERMNLLKEKMIYRTHGRIKVFSEVKLGDLITEVNEYCASLNIYAVVMGRERTGPVERFLFGGKTFSAMDHVSWPLIIIPPEKVFSGIRKVGLACDIKTVSETVPINEIKSLVKEFNAELHVLFIMADNSDLEKPEIVKESIWLQDALDGTHSKYYFITGTDTENDIMDFAEKNKFDFLIVIPRKHNLLDKIFGHSYSKNIVLHTHVPVLVMHE